MLNQYKAKLKKIYKIIILFVIIFTNQSIFCDVDISFYKYYKGLSENITKEYNFFSEYHNKLFLYIGNNNMENSLKTIDEYLSKIKDINIEVDDLLFTFIKNRFISYMLFTKAVLIFDSKPDEAVELHYLAQYYINKYNLIYNDFIYDDRPILPIYIYNNFILSIIKKGNIEEFKINFLLNEYDESFLYFDKETEYSIQKEENDKNQIIYYFSLIYDRAKPNEAAFIRNYDNLNLLLPLNGTFIIEYNPKYDNTKQYITDLKKNTKLNYIIKENSKLGFMNFDIIKDQKIIDRLIKKYLVFK